MHYLLIVLIAWLRGWPELDRRGDWWEDSQW